MSANLQTMFRFKLSDNTRNSIFSEMLETDVSLLIAMFHQTTLSKPNQPLFPRQNPCHIPLHAIELDESATLALQMIEHARQCFELRPASHLIRAMINLLHMRSTLQMTIQVSHRSESAAAKVTLVRVAIPSVFGRPGLPVPFQKVVRDDTVPIALSEGFEDALTIDAAGAGASAVFEMM